MNKILRNLLHFFLDLVLITLLTLIIFYTEMTVYLTDQAVGQMKIILDSKSMESGEKYSTLDKNQSDNLILIKNVKEYSVNHLYFNPSGSYERIYDQKGKTLIWLVTACEPFSLTAFEWNYPILGKLSYKGFFDSIKAIKEMRKLQKQGYDVDISHVQAWSTLGYLNDPIFSEMLNKSKGELAELIFHELFHGTIYAPGSTELNENLAEFIAKKATLEFLKTDTMALNSYKKQTNHEKELILCMLSLKDSLTKFYSSPQFNSGNTPENKHLKNKKLKSLSYSVIDQKNITLKSKSKIALKIQTSGNAYFMHYKRYNALEDSLENLLREKYSGKLDRMILDLKNNISSF